MMSNSKITMIIYGLLFALFWSSAATATKIGLQVAQPLTIAIARFSMASFIMIFYAQIIKKDRLPSRKEWQQLTVYGLLNISIYLGLYVIAMQEVTAGIGALAIAINPVFISFLSVFILKTKLNKRILISLLIGSLGVICASYPLLGFATVTIKGLTLLLLSMISYSAGAIYFSKKNWSDLSLFTINGWQTLIGGLFLLPLMVFYYQDNSNHFNISFWASVSWLAVLVSIVAVQLWLILLRHNPVNAGIWLFLCPIFGLLIAAIVTNESINTYTILGIGMVLGALYLSKLKKKKNTIGISR